MTPEEHIVKAEELIDLNQTWVKDWPRAANARASMAMVHLELAKWKESHE